MAELCSFRIGGPAAYLLSPSDIPSLCTVVRELYLGGVPYRILGAGSNLLPPDEGYSGVLISTAKLREHHISQKKLFALCGAPLNECILSAAACDLSGLERLYGIPASVGGAVFMNAGANGISVSDVFGEAELYDPATDTVFSLSAQEMDFSYRKSLLHTRNFILLNASFNLSHGEESAIMQTVRAVMKKRLLTQPLQYPSAGSVFCRPRPDTEVWRLIDACGLRGHRIGGAEISEKHAGFIINRERARAQDVRELMALCRRCVLERFGILLIPEIEILER